MLVLLGKRSLIDSSKHILLNKLTCINIIIIILFVIARAIWDFCIHNAEFLVAEAY